jgi:hypothetical protein
LSAVSWESFSADIEEEPDVVRLEDLKKAVHVFGGLFGFLFEVDFVAAGAKRGGGSVAQPLDVLGRFLAQINQVFVENSQDAVGSAVDVFDRGVFFGFDDDARDAGVDDGGRAARLGHKEVSD